LVERCPPDPVVRVREQPTKPGAGDRVLARIELPPDDVGRWLEPAAADRLRRAVVDAGFDRVAIDARGFRSGSLNVLGGVVSDAEPNDVPREAPAA